MSSAEFDDWHRLGKRTLGVTALTLAGIAVSAGVPTAIGLAKLDWKWIRYAPMSFMAPTLGLAAFGGLLKVADWFGMQQGAIQWALHLFGDLPLVFALLLLAAVALVVGVVGARGLFTTRSITVEERRLRGVDLVEPIGNRLSGAARVDAVATGMRKSEEDGKTDYHTLLPATPLALANRVAAEVLGEPISPTEAVRLRTYPLKARGRRLRWLLGSVVLLLAVFAVLGVLLTGVLLIIGAVLARAGA